MGLAVVGRGAGPIVGPFDGPSVGPRPKKETASSFSSFLSTVFASLGGADVGFGGAFDMTDGGSRDRLLLLVAVGRGPVFFGAEREENRLDVEGPFSRALFVAGLSISSSSSSSMSLMVV